MNRPLASLIAVAIIASACTSAAVKADTAVGAAARVTAPAADAVTAASAVNAFGLDLYLKLAAQRGDENIVISPTSIAIALSMARAGARGETATQMDAVLKSMATDAHASWINALEAVLASRSGTFKDQMGNDLAVTLRLANAPFAQQSYAFEQPYLDALSSRFGAGVRLVDYMASPEAARVTINGWVSDQTEHRIPELLAKGSLDQLTRLVLVNAIYLKAPWQTPFNEGATADGTFHRADGTAVTTKMMSLGEHLAYGKGAGWQVVELPYIGGSLAMDVIVPDDMASFQAGLTADELQAITASLSPTQVNLTVPRFGIETQADLVDLLTALGMPLAFDPDKADFSGMTTVEKLFIAGVIHQANIDVDEKGTTAAAATAVVMAAGAAPAEPVTLTVDRPFLFALRDLPTGAVVFLGRVMDPTTK